MATYWHPLPVRFIDLMQSNSPTVPGAPAAPSFLFLYWQLKNYWDLLQEFISCEVIQKILLARLNSCRNRTLATFYPPSFLPFPPSGIEFLLLLFFLCHFLLVKYAFDFLRCTFSLICQLAATSHGGCWELAESKYHVYAVLWLVGFLFTAN